MAYSKRTCDCGTLRASDVGKPVILAGWVNNYRDHGDNLVFIDLRDRGGLTQCRFNVDTDPDATKLARTLRKEDVIAVRGEVISRGENVNPKLPTGEIEVSVHEVQLLNKSLTPPFEVADHVEVNEDLRLKYRFLDLRRGPMQKGIITRHKVLQAFREFYYREGFLDIETPILTKSTPEGARDYLVPSRVWPGQFYALPQSPQLFKQLLMISGFDRYMQIARCFRDEDLRADRQP
ncbi:MAG: aspartate--tRNA ligase, partial [Planctomycetes bacterium]|nr:aspartate--tRNA ligase [Planctomycetota bacterium]